MLISHLTDPPPTLPLLCANSTSQSLKLHSYNCLLLWPYEIQLLSQNVNTLCPTLDSQHKKIASHQTIFNVALHTPFLSLFPKPLLSPPPPSPSPPSPPPPLPPPPPGQTTPLFAHTRSQDMSEYIQLFCRELEEMKSRESCLLTFEVD